MTYTCRRWRAVEAHCLGAGDGDEHLYGDLTIVSPAMILTQNLNLTNTLELNPPLARVSYEHQGFF